MGAENDRESEPCWGDGDAVDVAGALPVERVAKPPAFALERRERSLDLGFGARANAGAGGKSQPMAAGDRKTDRGQQQHGGGHERAMGDGEQSE